MHVFFLLIQKKQISSWSAPVLEAMLQLSRQPNWASRFSFTVIISVLCAWMVAIKLMCIQFHMLHYCFILPKQISSQIITINKPTASFLQAAYPSCQPGLLCTKVYSAFHPSGVGKWVPAVAGTHLHEMSRTRASSTGDSLISGEVSYTGWTLSTGFGSESASSCSDVCTRWLLNTCRPTANPSRAFLVVATCDRLTVVISTSHMWNLLRTEGVHLHTPALQTGTHFLLTLETIVFLFHRLGATSKPFSSLSTRLYTLLAHAAHLGFFFTKTRHINSLLLLGRQRQVWLIPIADEHVGVKVNCEIPWEQNTCYTWALRRWFTTKRRYIKCMHLLPVAHPRVSKHWRGTQLAYSQHQSLWELKWPDPHILAEDMDLRFY